MALGRYESSFDWCLPIIDDTLSGSRDTIGIFDNTPYKLERRLSWYDTPTHMLLLRFSQEGSQ